jgi:hypothetical protein
LKALIARFVNVGFLSYSGAIESRNFVRNGRMNFVFFFIQLCFYSSIVHKLFFGLQNEDS